MTTLANVYRGDQLESFHSGSLAIVDATGRLLAFAGDPSLSTFLRSAAKPFQAIPLLEYGGVEDYGLTPAEIALTCGSHGGEQKHVTTAAAILRKGEFDESDLLCGAHLPYDERAAAELRASGEPPSALHNNCSGKHAGMLLATQAMDLQSADYIAADHPLQVLMRSTLAEFSGVSAEEIPIAIDGCGVPSFHLSLHRAALAYARLMASAEGPESPGALARYAGSSAHVAGAMTTFPQYVAGNWSITTPLMEAFGGEVVAKEGAEGFYALGLAPSLAGNLSGLLRTAPGTAIGIALKINDGSMTRARNPVILRTLELLGIDCRSHPALQRYQEWPLRNVVGEVVGQVRSEFTLQVL